MTVFFQDGIPLGDADWFFATRSLVRKYRAVEKIAASDPPQVAEEEASLWRYLEEARRRLFAPFDVRLEMQRALVTGLQSGEFGAMGFSLPRAPSDQPKPVPPDLYQYRFFSWSTSSIKGAGLEFVGVRIFRLLDQDSTMVISSGYGSGAVVPKARFQEIPKERRGPNRPSMEPLINEIVSDLSAAGQFEAGEKQTSMIRKIRAEIARRNPEWGDISDETIRLRICEPRSADEGSKKQKI
jgi:hypothetical protein